jgi:chemotaxis protein MotB
LAKKKRRREKDSQGGGNWLTTYGDMVTLILTFFILLYSFSTIDVMKFQKMLLSFRGAVGIVDGGKSFDENSKIASGRQVTENGSSKQQTLDVLKVARQIQAIVKEQGLEDQISVSVNRRGVVVSIAEGLLFSSGQYELRTDGKKVLATLGRIFAEIPNNISAEGHSDSVPVSRSGVIKDNWDLSAIRSSRIISFLSKSSNLSSKRLQSVGYGKSRPIMPNDTNYHRQMNRRVDLVILS